MIWFHPENYLESGLREGKTPFFKELENELLQSDLDDAAAEQALLHYLEKLDEVARLEIVGVHEDDEDKVMHVFGRTFHQPHVYYYCRRDGATLACTPQERLGLDIEGDHVIPVRWNRKLMLIWAIFTEKAEEKRVKMPGPGQTLDAADRYWEIQLAWAEYQHGRWSGKNVSAPATLTAYEGEDSILFGERVASPGNKPNSFRIKIDDGDPVDPVDPPEPPDDPLSPIPPRTVPSTGPRRLVSKDKITFKGLVSGDQLAVRGYLRRDYRGTRAAADSQLGHVFGEFRFFGCRKIVTTAHARQIGGRNIIHAPTGTKFDGMWFTQTGAGLQLFDGTFPVGPAKPLPTPFEGVNDFASIADDPATSLASKNDIPVLGRTPLCLPPAGPTSGSAVRRRSSVHL